MSVLVGIGISSSRCAICSRTTCGGTCGIDARASGDGGMMPKTKPKPTTKPAAPPADDAVRVEYVDLDTLAAWPRNSKGHDLGAIHQSFDRFGFVSPIVYDEATARIVAGHGRLAALLQRRAEGRAAPKRIRVDP